MFLMGGYFFRRRTVIAPSAVIIEASVTSPVMDAPVDASILVVLPPTTLFCVSKVKMDVVVSPSGVVAVTCMLPTVVVVFSGIATRIEASGVIVTSHPVGIVSGSTE